MNDTHRIHLILINYKKQPKTVSDWPPIDMSQQPVDRNRHPLSSFWWLLPAA